MGSVARASHRESSRERINLTFQWRKQGALNELVAINNTANEELPGKMQGSLCQPPSSQLRRRRRRRKRPI